MDKKTKQTGITLKQYLYEYLAAKSPKSSKGNQTMATEYDCEKTFNKKILSLKKIIKSYIREASVQNLLEKELQDLRTIFMKNRNMNVSTYSKDINETTLFTKKGMKSPKSNISIPVFPIYDESMDELRTTNLAAQTQKMEMEVFRQELKQQPPKQEGSIRKSKTDSFDDQLPGLNNCQNPLDDHAPKLYKAYSKEYITKVIPAPVPVQMTPKHRPQPQKDCLPPKLQKMESDEEQSLRNTNNSKNSEAQYKRLLLK